MIHATDTTGEGGGGKSACDEDLQWNEGVEALSPMVKNHPFHAAATSQ
jgi:hypothetical protein